MYWHRQALLKVCFCVFLVAGCSFFFRVAWASWIPQVKLISSTRPAPIYMLCDCIFCLPWWRLKHVAIVLFQYELSSFMKAFYWLIALDCPVFLPYHETKELCFLSLFFASFERCCLPSFCIAFNYSLTLQKQSIVKYPLNSSIAEINSLVTFSKTSQPQKHRCSLDQYPQFPDKKKTVGMLRHLGGTWEKERMRKTLYTTTATLSF